MLNKGLGLPAKMLFKHRERILHSQMLSISWHEALRGYFHRKIRIFSQEEPINKGT